MSSKNMLLRSKAVRLTVARLEIMRLASGVGFLLVSAALMRETPLLLVLDEPPVALDLAAEHELLGNYIAHASRIARLTGAIKVTGVASLLRCPDGRPDRGASKMRKCNG